MWSYDTGNYVCELSEVSELIPAPGWISGTVNTVATA